jgi:hypothetical protein
VSIWSVLIAGIRDGRLGCLVKAVGEEINSASARRLGIRGSVGAVAWLMVVISLAVPTADADGRPRMSANPRQLPPGEVQATDVPGSPGGWLVGTRSDPVSDRIAQGVGTHKSMPGTSRHRGPHVKARMLITRLNTGPPKPDHILAGAPAS